MTSFLTDEAVNWTLGKLLGAPSIRTAHIEAAVILKRRDATPLVFGTSRFTGSGSVNIPAMVTEPVTESLTEAVNPSLPEVIEIGASGFGLMRCFTDDPDPARNAKKVAQAIGAAVAEGRTVLQRR